MTWVLSNYARLAAEKASVERLASDENWFALERWTISDFRLAAEGTITVHGAFYPVRLVYPSQFPAVPGWVEPQDRTSRWSRHQWGDGGSLCLELRPDNWHPLATGADLLRSAYHLFEVEGKKGAVASAHNTTDAQSYDWDEFPVLIGSGCLARISASTHEDVSALRWAAEDNVWPIMVFDAVDRAQPQHPPSFDWATFRTEIRVYCGGAAPVALPEDRAALLTALGIEASPPVDAGILVLGVEGETVTPFHSPKPDEVYRRKLIVLPDQTAARSGRAPLTQKIAVVGMGSIGAKLAESLLRSGIYHQLLIDGDVMLPANLERHSLDWRDVGYRKVRAVARRLKHIVPGAEIEVLATQLNWQRAAEFYAADIGKLARCDIIVDATGDLPTSMLLGAIAADAGKPFLSVAVFEGGLGCLIARSVPGLDAPFAQGRAAYQAFCDAEDVPPPQSGRRRYEAETLAGEPIVADDAAVTIAAGHAARAVLDILEQKIVDRDHAWVLLGLQRAWLFATRGPLIALNVRQPPAPAAAFQDSEIVAFASKLIAEALNAAKAAE